MLREIKVQIARRQQEGINAYNSSLHNVIKGKNCKRYSWNK